MNKSFKVDDTDIEIIKLLKDNGRLQWREIGEIIHLSGQAVGERVKRLIENGVITGFHASINDDYIEGKRTDFITISMTTYDHQKFIDTINQIDEIIELYRISGNGCYMINVQSKDQNELNAILEKLLQYANYNINSVVKRLK